MSLIVSNQLPQLPRLLYIGDVPIEASYHGSALLYRLLQDYPKDKLAVVETGNSASRSERRIEEIDYHAALVPFERLSRTRLHSVHETAILRIASTRAIAWSSFARNHGAEAVLTVTHGSGWIIAANVARRLNLPLHLICHDEWAHTGILQSWKDRVMGEHFPAAASRLCVSPFMAEEYERRYGAPGEILFPSRANDTPRHLAPPERLSRSSGSLTVVYAGTINSKGMVAALRTLAAHLEDHGGRLLLYGPLSPNQAKAEGLDADNVENRGLVSAPILMEQMRAEADVLYVPMSFDEADRSNMQISFPSKLTDYTAVGVPLLIHGPEYCSAVRWGCENAGVAEIVTDANGSGLDIVIARLAAEPAHRVMLGVAALEVGARYFDCLLARNILYTALQGGGDRPGMPAALEPDRKLR